MNRNLLGFAIVALCAFGALAAGISTAPTPYKGPISIDGGFLTVTMPDPCAPVGSDTVGGTSIGGDEGAGTIIVAQNDGGANRARLCGLTVNTPNPSGVEIVCGPSANGCAIDGGAGSTQTVIGNYYFSGSGITQQGAPLYVCPKAGDSMCVFLDGGAGWNALPGFKP